MMRLPKNVLLLLAGLGTTVFDVAFFHLRGGLHGPDVLVWLGALCSGAFTYLIGRYSSKPLIAVLIGVIVSVPITYTIYVIGIALPLMFSGDPEATTPSHFGDFSIFDAVKISVKQAVVL